jgi:hypothetical protein
MQIDIGCFGLLTEITDRFPVHSAIESRPGDQIEVDIHRAERRRSRDHIRPGRAFKSINVYDTPLNQIGGLRRVIQGKFHGDLD